MPTQQVAQPQAGKRLTRSIRAASAAVVDEKRRTAELSFSSTEPVERWFGVEVLSHQAGAINLARLNSGGPLLFNHDMNDVLGVVESARLSSDGKCRAVVRFGRDERGDWAMQQVADGVLRNVSVAYIVDEYIEDMQAGVDRYIAARWTPLEVSIVTVPADPTVGVGRSHPFSLKDSPMPQTSYDDDVTDQPLSRGQRRREARELEEQRVDEITAICRRYKVPADRTDLFIQTGATIQYVRQHVLDQVSHGQRPVASYADGSGQLGLSDGEVREFSIVRAIQAQLTNDWSQAGFERECSRAAAKALRRDTQGFFVPSDVQQRGAWHARSTYQVGTASAGGSLVATQLLANNFIEALRNEAQVMAAGATILSGLTGNVDVPQQSGVTSTYWVGESSAVTESEGSFDKVQLRPKTVGAISNMSRLTLLQTTPAIEMLVRQDLLRQIGLAVDLAALSGTGSSNQPQGIIGTAGVGSVAGGTNGAQISFDHLIQLETALTSSNAPFDRRGYLLNALTIGALKKIKATTGQYLWTMSSNGQRSGTPPNFNGYAVGATNQLRSTLTKGTSGAVCSELVFGAWDELLIGEWGTLEVLVNPYDSTGFTTGDVKIRALQTLDIAVKHPASFAVMSDALTS